MDLEGDIDEYNRLWEPSKDPSANIAIYLVATSALLVISSAWKYIPTSTIVLTTIIGIAAFPYAYKKLSAKWKRRAIERKWEKRGVSFADEVWRRSSPQEPPRSD